MSISTTCELADFLELAAGEPAEKREKWPKVHQQYVILLMLQLLHTLEMSLF